MVKKSNSSSHLIDCSEEFQQAHMEYGYGSGGDMNTHSKRVDATIQFFAQPQERHELKQTARRASLGGEVPYEHEVSVNHHVGELLFVQPMQQQQECASQRRHRRASMGAVPQVHDYYGNHDTRAVTGDAFYQIPPPSVRRRGSVSRSNSGGSSQRRQSQSHQNVAITSRSFDEPYHRPLPQRRGRRASTGGGMLLTNDDYQYHDQQPVRSRTRRQSLSNTDNSAAGNEIMEQGTMPSSQRKQSRRMSNGYSNNASSRQLRRMSNGYNNSVEAAPPPPAEPHTLKFGINPDVVARMSRRMSGNAAQAASQGLDDEDDDNDDEDDPDYGYAEDAGMGYGYAAPTVAKRGAATGYERRGSHRSQASAHSHHGAADSLGYGYGGPTPRQGNVELPKYERRGSNRSQASSRSRRRNSCVIRPEQDPMLMQEISVGALHVAESDLEPDADTAEQGGHATPSDSEDQQDNTEMYGYGSGDGIAAGISPGGNATSGDEDFDGHADSDKEQREGASDSEQSMSSTKRLRRNSCLMRPDGSISGGDQSFASGHRATTADTSKRGMSSDDEMHLLQGMDDDDDDMNDPDSLFNRSGYLNSVLKTHTKPKLMGKLGMHLARGKANNFSNDEEDDPSSDEESMLDVLNKAKEKKQQEAEQKKWEAAAAAKAAEITSATDSLPVTPDEGKSVTTEESHIVPLPHLPHVSSRKPEEATTNAAPPHLVGLKSSAVARARPLTTPHVVLSADNLVEVQKQLVQQPPSLPVISDHGNKILPASARNTYNWADIDFDSDGDDESEDSDLSFGASMYNDIQVFQELDRYKQAPRRRLSLDRSIIDMGAMLEERNGKVKGSDKRIPAFKPAAGCLNAADYVLRPFCARMRTGLTVIKHNKSRWSKSAKRVIYLKEDGRTLTWKPCEDDPSADINKGKRPKLDLIKCREVRHAWEPDPESRKKTGTATTRAKCTKEGVANKSFSLIFSKRTLDVTAASSDQCRMLMEGFSALCFRLQLEKLQKHQKHAGTATDDDSSDVGMCTSGSFTTDNDWASTVYGGDETHSMTQSAASKACATPTQSPWGL
ncbi:hypothetical protein MPSEU_000605200 [Mayamaea pseudoterrestris]|nr:hypothetical protein MPSEU_000605200 [Mayamaea pseudoterrestris]